MRRNRNRANSGDEQKTGADDDRFHFNLYCLAPVNVSYAA